MKRQPFNLSHYKLATGNMGQLIPVTWVEALPGDYFQHKTQALIRCQQLLAPLMHPVHARIHHWLIPIRLLWEDFPDFITGGADGTSTPVPPYFTDASVGQGSIDDYLSVPVGTYSPSTIYSALPVRAYDLVYNTFYRDQQLQTPVTISTASGEDTTSYHAMKNVSWEKDYFTTCRPEPQLGAETIIPIAANADVVTDADTGDQLGVYANQYSTYRHAYTQGGDGDKVRLSSESTTAEENKMYADLSTSTGIEITDLRMALSRQRFQERMNKSGSTYHDYLSYLGIKHDARLQRPEYLGGGRTPLQFSEVLATDGTNTGQLYGHGIGAMRTNQYRRFIPEHSIILSLLSVVPKSIYSNGLHRSFSRTIKEDYFQREYEFSGDQVVKNKEVYLNASEPDGAFGYQTRYDEYRTHPSSIAGEFTQSELYHWHLARMLGSEPALNSTFVTCNPATRPFAAPTTDQLYIYCNHHMLAKRNMRRIPGTKTF